MMESAILSPPQSYGYFREFYTFLAIIFNPGRAATIFLVDGGDWCKFAGGIDQFSRLSTIITLNSQ